VSVCVLTLSAASAQAGIIDDNALDADHQNLANQSQYDAVGTVFRLNNQSQLVVDSSGILLNENWVLTAAHTEVAKGRAGSTFEVNGEVRNVIDAIQHPSFIDIEDGWDLGLLKLDAPINNVTPAQLYTGTAASLVGETLTYVGYGRSGTGSTGDTIAAGTKRAGNNKGDQLGYTLNPGQPDEIIYSNQIIFADMDDPPGGLPYGNPVGSNIAINNEYLIALGDSGGGLFFEDNGQHFLTGVHSLLFNFDPFNELGYGDMMGSTTIELALNWIIDTIAPPPIIGDLDGDGFVGLDDIDIILANWNTNVTPGDLSMGDATGEGFVGLDDLDVVLNNWNAGTPPSLANTFGQVPEPGTAALLGIAGTYLTLQRRRRAL